MALGAVPTGSMHPQEAATAVGTTRSRTGATRLAMKTAPGSSISAVEVFDTHMLTKAVADMALGTSRRGAGVE
jgi:hypothetical protein